MITSLAARRLAMLAAAGMIALSGCGTSSSDVLVVDAVIDGTDLDDADAFDPVALSNDESELVLTMTNTSDEPQVVRYLRLEGETVGLTMLTYTTRVGVELAPGEERSVTVPLDFFDIDAQAHGFLRAKLALYAPDRELLGSEEFAVDVRGAPTSTMAMFAWLLLAMTLVSIVANLTGLARGTLPSNRFRRGLRFATSGLGVGLLLTVGFSVLRIFPLPAVVWWPLIVLPTIGAFAFGYVAPGFDDDVDPDDLDDLRDLDDALASAASQAKPPDGTRDN